MRTFAVGLIGTLLATGTAVAADPPDFTFIDKDLNGYLSRDEARVDPNITDLFASVDVDHDDQLNTAEFMEAVKQLRG